MEYQCTETEGNTATVRKCADQWVLTVFCKSLRQSIPILLNQSQANDMASILTGRNTTSRPARYEEAKAFVIATNRTSIASLQRHLRVGYEHAEMLIEFLESDGVISKKSPTGEREVLIKCESLNT